MKAAIFMDVKLNRNGVGSYYSDLADFFRDNNIDVDIYNLESPIKNIISIKFPKDRTQKITLPNYFELKNKFYNNRPDIVFISFYGPYSFFGVRLARQLKIPYIYVINNDVLKFLSHYFSRPLSFLLGKMSSHIEKKLINNAQSVVLVNPHLKHIPNRYTPKKIVTMGTLVNKIFINSQKPEPVSKISSILYYGRLAIEKNLNMVINSAIKLPHLNFSIAGDGPLRELIQESAKKHQNFTYLGWIDRSKIIDTIDSNDVVVMPSSFETFGTVALEALSRGRVVVINKDHGIKSFDILNECLFDLSDFGSLENAIKEISRYSTEKISSISQKSYEAVLKYDDETKLTWINLLNGVNSPNEK